MSTLASILSGAAITWLVSWWYYRRAGNELRAEAAEPRRLTTLILRALEDGGIAKLNRDDAGKIVGLVLQLRAAGVAASSGSAVLSVKRSSEPQ